MPDAPAVHDGIDGNVGRGQTHRAAPRPLLARRDASVHPNKSEAYKITPAFGGLSDLLCCSCRRRPAALAFEAWGDPV